MVTERATPPPLFGLASHGVCPASLIAQPAVRSYRTFSPLLAANGKRYIFCGTFRSARFDAHPRPLTGMLPYEDRTFLSTHSQAGVSSGCPTAQVIFSIESREADGKQ